MGLFVHLYLPHSENIMAIQAIVFDIGGVLEFTPCTGWIERWEAQLQLQPGGFQERLGEVWAAGSLGTISLEDVERRISITTRSSRTPQGGRGCAFDGRRLLHDCAADSTAPGRAPVLHQRPAWATR